MSMLFQLLFQSVARILCIIPDALYPRHCPVCGQIVLPKSTLICPACLPKLSYTKGPVRRRCGKRVFSNTVEYCFGCARRHCPFEYGLALTNYNNYARYPMVAIKYKNKHQYLDFHAEAICQRYAFQAHRMNVRALVPVPIHPFRKRQRGFNRAELLANNVGARLGVPVYPFALLRDKKTPPQKQLNPSERLRNLQQAFRPGTIPPGITSVILTDDIYTTDSTVEARTRVLLPAGIRHVYIIIICIDYNT